jgi:transcriptional regulator with XRE-family HTH domain
MQPLVDKRRSLHLTQKDVAEHMGITVGRVSQIEAGEVAGIDVLERYIALGGTLQLSASFSD